MRPAADSPDALAFRRAVVADPADDLPRLVYADWLDDHGDPDRAEFVRVQVEQARTPDLSPRGAALARRAAELIAGNTDWAADVKAAHKLVGAWLGRGFVEAVTVYSKRFVEHGTALLDAEPVTGVKLATLRAARGSVPLAAVLAAPHARRVRSLDLSTTPLTAAEVWQLNDPAALANLDTLTLGPADADGPLDLAAIVVSLPALTGLHLESAAVGANAIRNMAGAAGIRRLTQLTLPDGAAAPALAANADAAGLRVLAVREGEPATGADAVEALAASPHLAGVEDLTLHGLTGDGFAALAAAPRLDGLRYLRLVAFELDPAALARLAPRLAPRLLGLAARFLPMTDPPRDWLAEFQPLFPATFLDLA